MTQQKQHHDFSPSRLEQLRLCPGSYQMQQGIVASPSAAADEGTLLHNAVATGSVDGLSGEQAYLVEQCLNFISWISGGYPTHNNPYIKYEEYLTISDGSTGEIVTAGTADCIIFNEISANTATLIDWKFGYTPVNDVAENIQLATYALGVMQKYNLTSVDAWVYQPRIKRQTHHLFTNGVAILANIRSIIKHASGDNIILKPSDSACRYCSARLNCPAFRVKYQKLAASRNDYDLSDTSTLEMLYESSKGLKTFFAEVENAVKAKIEETGSCGKYQFQLSDGAREIKDLNALYAVVKDYLTPSEFNSVCKVTLGKLETALAERMIAQAQACGNKMTKVAAKDEVNSLLKDLVTRSAPTKKIVEVA